MSNQEGNLVDLNLKEKGGEERNGSKRKFSPPISSKEGGNAMRKLIPLLILGLLVAISIPVDVSSQPKKDIGIDSLTIVSGPVGGSWYPIGAKLGEIFARKFNLKTTVDIGGSAENVRRVNAGKDADLGLASNSENLAAYNGLHPFKKKLTNFNLLGCMMAYTYQVMIREGSGVTSWEDLRDKRIAPGKAGLGGEILTRHILEEAGLSYETIRSNGGTIEHRDYRPAVEAMKDGHLDAIMITMPYPIPLYEEYLLRNKGYLLPVGEPLRSKIIQKYPIYCPFEFPAGVYKGQNTPIPTIQYWSTFIVRADLPESVVYELSKALWESEGEIRAIMAGLRDFGVQNALTCKNIPVHPGAKKYFQEIGIWKD